MGKNNLITKLQEEIGYVEGICNVCREQISENNTHTDAGWREASISNTCENCFDAMFEDKG